MDLSPLFDYHAPQSQGMPHRPQDTDFKNWRVSPHYSAVNLVRSGRKQPQLMSVSAGGKARLLIIEGVTLDRQEGMHVSYIGSGA